MNEQLVIVGILCHALSGVPGLFLKRTADAGQKLAVVISFIGSALGVLGALRSFWFPSLAGEFIRLDGLAVIFLLPMLLLPLAGNVYGLSYWKQADHQRNGQKLRLFYGLVTAGMCGVTIAANSIFFMIAWEFMALGAFFLVTTEDEDNAVREAGWVYLVATHMATLCLFALFAVMHSLTGSYALAALPGGPAVTVIFLLALVGFGFKSGLMPFHIWLPGAHEMSPGHVSALLSGVLLKIGIYGLLRVGSLLPVPPLWWGGVLLTAGTISGLLGVLFSIGQRDLKRLLAYSSIENIGIIFIGLGLASVGRTLQRPDLVMLGLAGALLHVWNHALFKTLLFLCAGNVVHATHTREIDQMGGLAKVMPHTTICFAIGALAICGLPPLNGFVSELLIYLGLFGTLNAGHAGLWAGAALAAPALAMIGALAVACFVRAFGTVFLGVARSEQGRHAHASESLMVKPLMVLAGCCLVIGLAPLLVAPVLESGARICAPELAGAMPSLSAVAPLKWVTLGGVGLIGLCALLGSLLYARIKQPLNTTGPTWDCGYAAPSARMQYTGSSFGQMLVTMFGWVLRPRIQKPGALATFPKESRFHSQVPDLVLESWLAPTYRFGARAMASFHFLQAGSVQVYLLYIVVFLILLLLWR